MTMTPREVVELMRSSRSEAEWNANCNLVKIAFGGEYPDFWYDLIIRSGLAWEHASLIANQKPAQEKNPMT